MEFHNSNNKARNALFLCLSLGEFERVGHLSTTHQIRSTLERFHEGNDHVKARLFETYRREYENFTQLAGETIDSMFSRFQSIVNKMHANKAQLPYSDHERALKLLQALDQRVWEVKVSVIIESPNYKIMDELFSKLKSIEIDHQTQAKIENASAPTMALVFGGGSASNSSLAMFALSSLLSITKEQVESLGDEELALVVSRFTRFHKNRMSRRRGGSKDRCYNCGDPDHFVASCPKKGKLESGPRDHHSGRRRASTPPASTSLREDSTTRRSRRSTFRRQRSRSMPSSPPSATSTTTPTMLYLPRAMRRLRGGSRTS
jgi:hypothetical protein